METNKQEPGCCPEFHPEPWHDRFHDWNGKPFIRDHVWTFFFIPLNFGSVMRRIMGKVEQAGAEMPDYICLSDHTSRWNMDVYLAVNQRIENADNHTFTGRYYSRVYEGKFSETGRWTEEYKKSVAELGLTIDRWYMWYTTCPKCARKSGRNPVVILCSVH